MPLDYAILIGTVYLVSLLFRRRNLADIVTGCWRSRRQGTYRLISFRRETSRWTFRRSLAKRQGALLGCDSHLSVSRLIHFSCCSWCQGGSRTRCIPQRSEIRDLDGRYMFSPIAFIARVHSVHVMNVEQRQAAADPHLTWAARPPVYESIFYVSYYFALLLRKVICCINFIRLAVFRCYATKGLTEA